MIAELSLEPSKVELKKWYWHGIEDNILLRTRYIPLEYNFDRRKGKRETLVAKQQLIRTNYERYK